MARGRLAHGSIRALTASSIGVVLKHGPLLRMLGFAVLLTSCASGPPAPPSAPARTGPVPPLALIGESLPRGVADRAGWSADLRAAFTALGIEPSHEHICAVIAVIEQESGFQVDPVIPDLPAIAWREIDRRAERAGIPSAVVHGVLELTSSNGRSYADRIDHAKTEKQLSDIFEDFTGSVPLGRGLFASWNPIRTRGPMQVNVAFAEQFAAARPYPYPVNVSIADEVFTRRGSVYFGTAHLLAYPAAYDRYLYRFADYNAGQYASRNAAFQRAVSGASGIPLTADGALLPHDKDAKGAGTTELAVLALAGKLNLSEAAIHNALEQGKTQDFERTALYLGVFALAERAAGRPLPRAVMPRIELQGPKLTRRLTTDWYAHRVDARYERCLNQ
jgi:hypothetical protein